MTISMANEEQWWVWVLLRVGDLVLLLFQSQTLVRFCPACCCGAKLWAAYYWLVYTVQCTLVTSVHRHLNFEISLAYKYISCCQWTKWIIIIFFPNIFSSSKNDWFLEIIGNYCSDALRFIRNDPHQSLSHVNILKFDQTSKNYTSNPIGFNVLLLPRIWHSCHINQKKINQNRHTKTKSTVSICVSAEL